MRINYQDSLGTPYTATRVVRGVGSTVGLIAIDQKSDGGGGLVSDFGATGLGSSSDRVFTVTNIGGGPVSAMSFASLGTAFAFAGGSFPGTKGDCGTMLAAGATCSVDIVFTPTTAGDFSTLLSLTYNDGSATQGASRTLIGQGSRRRAPDDHGLVGRRQQQRRAVRLRNVGRPDQPHLHRLELGEQARVRADRRRLQRALLLDGRQLPGRGRDVQRHARGGRVVQRRGDVLGRDDRRREDQRSPTSTAPATPSRPRAT